MTEPPLFGFVAGLVALVLVLEPIELPLVAPEPIAPEDAPMELLEPMALPEPVAADDEPMEEELPMLLELSVDGALEELEAGGVMAGVVVVSSTFLPQAPRDNMAARATAVAAAGLILNENMRISFKLRRWICRFGQSRNI